MAEMAENPENWKYPKSPPYFCWNSYKHGFGQISLYLDDSGSTSLFVWRKRHFSEKSPFFIIFARKTSEILQFFPISYIFLCFYHHPMQDHDFSDFGHNWNNISRVITQKVPKLAQFWPPNFLIKVKNALTSTNHISGTVDFLRHGLRRWNRNEKYANLEINLFFDLGPPIPLSKTLNALVNATLVFATLIFANLANNFQQ